MKQLCILILSFLFLSASLCSRAGTISKEFTVENIEGCVSCNKSVGHITGDEHHAIVAHAVHRTGGSTAQWKLLRWINFADAYLLSLRISPDDPESFFNPYLYCKPIRLQLIFPQHYFW